MFRFIDLFAGIGGIRQGFEPFGGRCVFTSEWDTYSQKTYKANFADSHDITGDITQVDAASVPDHDILLAGFPCQPFSIAGVSKKNSLGRAHGFACETQGTLFFDVCRIIEAKQPKAFLLENVKNLTSHDKGKTFEVIKCALFELGYDIHFKVVDGAHFVPQHRERIIIVGFKKEENIKFSWDDSLPPKGSRALSSILHKSDGTEPVISHDMGRFFDYDKRQPIDSFTLSDGLWTYLQNYAQKHKEKGNGFGYGLVTPETTTTRTLSARYYKDGSEILLHQEADKNPRKLTPRECARLMGFPDSFVIPVSNTRAYKQFGNSVVVPAIAHVASLMITAINEANRRKLPRVRSVIQSSAVVRHVASM